MNRTGTLAAIMIMLSPAPGAAQSFADVDAAVLEGIQRGLYPGAVVVIGRRDSILYARGYGHFTWRPVLRRSDTRLRRSGTSPRSRR